MSACGPVVVGLGQCSLEELITSGNEDLADLSLAALPLPNLTSADVGFNEPFQLSSLLVAELNRIRILGYLHFLFHIASAPISAALHCQ